MRCNYQGPKHVENHVNSSVDACISGHIKLEHVITCTFGCTNGEMHVESFSDVFAIVLGLLFFCCARREDMWCWGMAVAQWVARLCPTEEG